MHLKSQHLMSQHNFIITKFTIVNKLIYKTVIAIIIYVRIVSDTQKIVYKRNDASINVQHNRRPSINKIK